MGKYYLIMDIGGTKTTGALFTEDGKPVDNYFHVVKSQTYQGEEAVYQNTKSALDHVIEHFHVNMDDVLGIGVGGPGPLDVEKGVIIHSPMMGWKNFPVVDRLKQDYGKPVRMDNDGNLGALAEQRCGEGKGLSNVLYMTVSTGCGGGAVINGNIYHGRNDSAAEFGHITLNPEGPQCPCGSRGCFEMYASGTAMKRRMIEDIKAGKKSAAFEAVEYDPEKIEGKYLTQAAENGDAYALEFYRQEGYYLGCGLATLFNAFDPDVFVLGGGVTKARKYFHEEMMKQLQGRTMMEVPQERIRYSVMNDYVVLYGAYYLIKEYLEQQNK
ncbi:MAG: ROK family protein [Eubacteriales bacterium]|nr:ROK family protein [Eubacteriales bacterium]